MKASRLYVVNLAAALIPPTRLFWLKRALLRWAGASVGANVRIVSSARFHLTGKLSIGENSYLGEQLLIAGGDADVVIGRDVDIGPRVTIVTGTHVLFGEPNKAAGQSYSRAISIGDGAWIGCSATILGGSQIGERCMVAACALVKGSIPPSQVVGGIPATQLKRSAPEDS